MSLMNALLPLIRPLQLTLLNPFSTKSLNCTISNRFNACSVTAIILLTLTIYHGIANPHFYNTAHTSIGNTIIFLKLCGVRLGHIVILLESYVKRRELMKLMNILSSIDVVLVEKLGVDVGHKKLRSMILMCLTLVFTFMFFIEGVILLIYLNYFGTNFLIFWVARLFSFSIICLRYFQIITFIYIIQSRVTMINFKLNNLDTEFVDNSSAKCISTIGYLREDNQNTLKTQSKKFTDFEKISILRQLFGRLWDVSKLINQCFGVSLLVCIGNDFGAVTLNGYWMYISYKKSASVTYVCGTALWSLSHLAMLMFIAGFCYCTVGKANETALIVHKIDYDSMDGNHSNLDSRMEQFSLQLLHQKLTFNACGFFVIDFALIFTIIGAITTYLVILIQFQMSN